VESLQSMQQGSSYFVGGRRLTTVVSTFGVSLFVGCANLQPYKTPELFHPRTAAAKSILESSLNGQVTIAGPGEALKSGKNGSYEILVYDRSVGTGETAIQIHPSEIGAIKINKDKPSVVTIDRKKIADLDNIEIWVKGRAALNLSPGQAIQQNLFARTVFPVESETEIEERAPAQGEVPIGFVSRSHHMMIQPRNSAKLSQTVSSRARYRCPTPTINQSWFIVHPSESECDIYWPQMTW
jgi:hypothetical protein